jgi:hypothetical protein
MSNQDVIQVKKMLEALLKSEGLVEWVGGYVYGATSAGDPFVILYPASEYLKEKVCRVYPHQFKKLPGFIKTDGIVGDTERNPSKGDAERAGIYHECPPFKIVMHLGKETQMGREKRFSDVLYVPQRRRQEPGPDPAGNVNKSTQNGAPDPAGNVANWQQSDAGDDDEKAAWRVKAVNVDDPFIFDTIILELSPWFENSSNVQKFREILFDDWKAGHTEDYVIALEAYALQRMQLNGSLEPQEAHRRAKEHALGALKDTVQKQS